MALALIAGLFLLVLVFGPQLWVSSVIRRNARHRPDLQRTGGQFARHVLDGMKLQHVGVEETRMGDHYDPETRTVRLSPDHFGGHSLSATVIAAHEVGHAMQHATEYKPLLARTKIAKDANRFQQMAMVLLMATPFLVLIAKSPAIMVLQFVAVLILVAGTVLMHATTLPVEYDASFKRAMPLLKDGQFLDERDLPAAREILRAAALTYVAAAATSLLDITRWIRMLRF